MKLTRNNIAIIEGDECISKWVNQTGRLDHDQSMIPIVLQHIPKNGTVIDAGAYIGDHTIAYSNKVGENGTVYAFEPSWDAYKCLCHNMQRNKNTLLFNVALGKENGYCDMQDVQTNFGMNHIKEGTSVQIMTLDGIFDDNRLDFIKIDVEGYELDVLKGSAETIKKFKPVMLIEINELTLTRNGLTRVEIFNWLTENGYKYKNVYHGKGLHDYQMDILCEGIA